MLCPQCQGRLKVAHTDDYGDKVVRVRFCPTCRHIFRTVESQEKERDIHEPSK